MRNRDLSHRQALWLLNRRGEQPPAADHPREVRDDLLRAWFRCRIRGVY